MQNIDERENDNRTDESTEPMLPIDMIYDENNNDNIVLYNEKNEPVEFEQIALIPMEGKVYVILKPVCQMAGMQADEALVFSIEEVDDEECILLVDDFNVIDKVFDVYYQLLRENGINVD